jgi:hypothetical protein
MSASPVVITFPKKINLSDKTMASPLSPKLCGLVKRGDSDYLMILELNRRNRITSQRAVWAWAVGSPAGRVVRLAWHLDVSKIKI